MSIKLVAFQGPSASGKSTLQQLLGVPKVVTWTSRMKRAGEINGKDYYFATQEQMLEMHKNGKLLEMTEYQNHYYGINYDSINEICGEDNPRSIVVDANGADELKKRLKNELLLIGVSAPIAECQNRLKKRNTAEEEIQRRLFSYHTEIEQLKKCNLIINNADEYQMAAELLIKWIKKGLGIPGNKEKNA